MAVQYNPPPNWPAPPPGWTPPPGWQPDPAWGPAPHGWQLWTKARPNTRAWRWSFLSALALYLLLILALSVGLGGFNAELAGELFGAFLFAGAIVGLVARRMSVRWSRWVYPVAVFAAFVLIRLLSVMGQTNSMS